jgi:hypothetical protein
VGRAANILALAGVIEEQLKVALDLAVDVHPGLLRG